MKITAEELRKVYADAESAFENENFGASGIDAALLAVARYVAERQRGMEPTKEMADVVEDDEADLYVIYRAMQSVAPLVVD